MWWQPGPRGRSAANGASSCLVLRRHRVAMALTTYHDGRTRQPSTSAHSPHPKETAPEQNSSGCRVKALRELLPPDAEGGVVLPTAGHAYASRKDPCGGKLVNPAANWKCS